MKTKNKYIIQAILILLVGILFGRLIFGGSETSEGVAHEHGESGDEIWTCSMHPEIRSSGPGDCPICGMDLIPMDSDEDEFANPATYVMSKNAMKLANVSTMEVGQSEASKEIRLNGKVVVDERNSYSQSTHIPGRIEQLHINFTGEQVSRGQTLAVVYSPEMTTAQEELLQAYEIREDQPELFEAAQEKLRNWRIGENQINKILSDGKPLEQFPIIADVSGIVTEKLVDLGDYIERGMPIYEISDLSKVWVLFDLYESEIGWVREGSKIEYKVRSVPGETFEDEIRFIDPLVNSQTRVATARVEVDNSERRLKPGMFASGTVKTELDEAGPDRIVVPKSAVLWTGPRSVVYIKEDAGDRIGFTLREVVLGPSLGDAYVIEEGLEAGEEIVVNGTFTVDAAVQLSGRPSMMNPEGEASSTGHDHGEMQTTGSTEVQDLRISGEAKGALEEVVHSYLDLKNALVRDDFEAARDQVGNIQNKLGEVEISAFNGTSADAWENYNRELENHFLHLVSAEDISELREGFVKVSTVMIRLVASFDPLDERLYIQHCPMANSDMGAEWLSLSEEIRNPYYGSAMLTCGEVTGSID